MRALASSVLLLVLQACSGSPSSVVHYAKDGLEAGDVSDTRSAQETVLLPAEVISEVHAETPDFSGTVDADIFQPVCRPGEGCLGDPCADNTDCNSAWCVEHMGDKVCTQTCEDECPDGWACTQAAGAVDLTYVCVSLFPNLCRPCTQTADCATAVGTEDACVLYGEQGSFCGGRCDDDSKCPWGFVCAESLTAEGSTLPQCIVESGQCPCTDTSVELGLSTACVESNEHGSCSGVRICTDSGLSDCSAAVPEVETCNGLDDDCDEETDEPLLVDGDYLNLCDDDNPCTQDKCGAQQGCLNTVLAEGACDDTNPCTVADHCDAGACVGEPVLCQDGNPCTDDLCTAEGGCSHPPLSGPCDDQDSCTLGDQCLDGVCLGEPVSCECKNDQDCLSLEDGDHCNGMLSCDTNSLPYLCSVLPETVVVCAAPEGPDAFCLEALCASETGDCSLVPQHEGLPCQTFDKCVAGAHCVQGVCTPGDPLNCNDANPCTDDSCDPETGCLHVPNETACFDGDVCTVDDHCDGGACVAGAVMPCEDSNPCTETGCDKATGCWVKPLAGVECDDFNACTLGDTCQNGLCVGGPALVCQDDDPCTDLSCVPAAGCITLLNSAPCDDQNICTTNDHCQLGVCGGGANLVCADNNVCTDDTCSPLAGCQFTPNNAECEDGDLCTLGDECAGGWCLPGPAPGCSDDNPCTDDSCQSDLGCVYSVNNLPCEDGDPCTEEGACVDGECQPGQAVVCNDDNVCTDDWCEAGVGCVFEHNEAQCDDADPCTLEDDCFEGLCAGRPCSQLGLTCTPAGCAGGSCNSLTFDGVDDQVVVAHAAELSPGKGNFTVEFWARSNTSKPDGGKVVCKRAGNNYYWVQYVATDAGIHIGVWFVTGAGHIMMGGDTTAPLKQWNHVAVQRRDGGMELFINGEAISTTTTVNAGPADFSAHNVDNTGSLLISQNAVADPHEEIRGALKALRITSKAVYSEPFEPESVLSALPETVLLFLFEEGAGDLLNDASGNGNTGTVFGATWGQDAPGQVCCAPYCPDGACGDDGCGSSCGPCPPVCGNGVLETGEGCDDSNLAAGDGCNSACLKEASPGAITPGMLVITEIMKNPVAVEDGAGEWFELFNVTDQPVDINGWTIGDEGVDSHLIKGGDGSWSYIDPPAPLGPVTFNTYSHGGGYSPHHREFWYPGFSSYTVHRYDSQFNEIGTFQSPHNTVVQLWGTQEGAYYTANWTQHRIRKYPGPGEPQTWEFDIGWTAAGVCYENGTVYAMQDHLDKVWLLDPATGAHKGTVHIPGAATGFYGALICTPGRLYYGEGLTGLFRYYDLATQQQIGTFQNPAANQNAAFDGKVLYVSANNSTVYRYQLVTANLYGEPLVVQPGQTVVLGINSDPDANGGIAVQYQYDGFLLGNGDDEVVLRAPGGAVIDQVNYTDEWFPDVAGSSLSLSAHSTGAALNDDAANWCASSAVMDSGDHASPGAPNPYCN